MNRRGRARHLALAGAFLLGGLVSAQQNPATGTALVLGRVLDAEGGAPLAGVVVTISSTALQSPPIPPDTPQPRSTLTDKQGRFVFRQLPKGSYTMTATVGGNGFSPNGFLITGFGFQIGAYLNGGYGQRRPNGPMQQIELAEGQRIGDAVIRLWKGATIDGTVRDETGEPLVGVVVGAVRQASTGRLLTGPTTKTDDRGAYHFSALAPGTYLVFVPQTQVLMPASTIDAAFAAASATGNTQPLFQSGPGGTPPAGLSGVAIGATVISIGPQELRSNGLAPRIDAPGTFAYQTTFAPSSSTATRATPVALKVSEQRMGVDVTLRPVRTASVSGTLTDASGPAVNFGVHLMPADADDGSSLLEVATSATDASGRFTFPAVPIGTYTLLAVSNSTPPSRGGGPAAQGAWAEQSVSIDEGGIGNIAMTLRPGARISGRVEFRGTSDRLPPARVGVMAVLSQPRFRNANTPQPTAAPDTTGQFTLTGIAPGRYFIRVPNIRPWTLESVVVGGRDVTDVPFVVGTDDLNEVAITFTDRPAEVSGVVQDSSSIDAESTVFLFPADRTRWADAREARTADGRDTSRACQTVRVARNGAFTIANVIPGDYLIVAAREDPTSDWPDPAFLAKLAASAERIPVAAGQKQLVTLKTSR